MNYITFPVERSAGLEAADVVGECMGSGTDRVLFDHGALPPEFFDLSTGIAGDFMQKFSNYRIRAAVVIPDPAVHSASFQEFAREARSSRQCRFFPDRDEAITWLSVD